MNVNELITAIKSTDPQARADAWLNAGPVGAPALAPLARLVPDENFEMSRAARRAMWKIVRHAGRPGAPVESSDTVRALLDLLANNPPRIVGVEVLWMLSEIGDDESVAPIAACLRDVELREDARMVLERIEGKASLDALKEALAKAPDDFKLNIAQSLRRRGVEVGGLPCQKLVPTKKTSVQPVGR
jgi:HEAT repeat protein